MITLQNTGSNITLQTIAASGFCLDVVILLPASQLRDIDIFNDRHFTSNQLSIRDKKMKIKRLKYG